MEVSGAGGVGAGWYEELEKKSAFSRPNIWEGFKELLFNFSLWGHAGSGKTTENLELPYAFSCLSNFLFSSMPLPMW